MLKKLINYSLLFFVIFNTQLASAAKISPETTTKIENYLNSLDKKYIEFSQDNTDKGILIIDKKYGFRFNYLAPHPLTIIGSTKDLKIYDHALNEAYYESIKNSSLKIFSDKQFKIEKLHDFSENDNFYSLTFREPEFAINYKLIFAKQPLQIKQIIINNEQTNNYNIISFTNFKNIEYAKLKLFVMRNPKDYGPQKQLSQQDILNLIKFAE